MLKREEAITLIALVITIVVMLILATITLNLTLGENGIFKRAKQATMLQKKARYIEEIEVEISNEQMDRLLGKSGETFIVSLQKRLEGTPTASLNTQTTYTKKDWVKNTLINLNRILVVYTVDDYQILIEVDNENNTAKIVDDSFTKKGKDCTISFDGNNASGSVDSITITEGLYIELPDNGFTKANNTFVGWFKNSAGEGERYNPGESYRVTENETLYASWSQHAITIAYNPGFETEDTMNDTTIAIGSKDNLLKNTFERLGYTFTGWKDQENHTYTDEQEITASINLTLTAQWTPTEYEISYDLDGGALESGKTNPTTYTIETTTTTLNNPLKEGYTFTGWTGSNGNTPQTTVSLLQGSTNDKSYTANWEPQAYSVTIYSAPSDQLYYYQNNNKVILGTTDSTGKLAGVSVKNGATIYSSVAKDLTDLSNPYCKTFNITSNTTIYLMPNGEIFYWYGYNPVKCDVIANYYGSNEYNTAATVNYNTNSIYLKTNGSGGTISCHVYLNNTLRSAQEISSITKAHLIATDACAPCMTKTKSTQNSNTMTGANPNQLGTMTIDINNGNYKSWTYSYSGTDSGYLGFRFAGGWNIHKEATFYALWFE